MMRTIIILGFAIVGVWGAKPKSNGGSGGSGGNGGSGGRFNEDTGSGSSLSGGSGDAYPNYYRLEVEIQNLENTKGLLANGKVCDSFNKCDPRVHVFIDTDKPFSPTPGTSSDKQKWQQIFQVDNNDSPTIGKSVTKDICGGSLFEINARVFVVDVDVGVNDPINDFDCIFHVTPKDVARDAKSAQWIETLPCRPKFQSSNMGMNFRYRVYEIDANNCQASDKTGGRLSTDSGSLRPTSPHVPGKHDLVRLDVELVQLTNPQGISKTKKACDQTNACDPAIFVNLDNDIPLAKWPGSKTVPQFQKIFAATNQNSPTVNKNVTKDFCGGSMNIVNLRAHVIDEDSVSSNDEIGDFECVFVADYSRVARDISSSDWSATQDCNPLQDIDVRLQFRYRIYDITDDQCGIKSSS